MDQCDMEPRLLWRYGCWRRCRDRSYAGSGAIIIPIANGNVLKTVACNKTVVIDIVHRVPLGDTTRTEVPISIRLHRDLIDEATINCVRPDSY
jgi:hypothetical protein